MTTNDKLRALSNNIWWSWNPPALELFRQLNEPLFAYTGGNPVAVMGRPDEGVLASAAFQHEVDSVYADFAHYMAQPPADPEAPPMVYLCMEFGLHESLPLYSGGLGILAGDHIKAASDLGIDLTAVGLFLRDGYFKQFFGDNGWQQAEYPGIDPLRMPVEPVLDENQDWVTVSVPIANQHVRLRAWRLQVGRVSLYLLDSDFEANHFELRSLTRRLYSGDRRTRIQQELVLGIGGARMLEAVGATPTVFHMNEGHCAFLTFELLSRKLAAGLPRGEAVDWVRRHTVFTTHTPVKAGHDRFDPDLFGTQLSGFASESGISLADLFTYGRVNGDDQHEPFTMTILGLRLAGKANGVSRLNGEVARAQWHHLYPDGDVDQVPIGHVTNGVHMPTWASRHARPFLASQLGPNWPSEPDAWERVADIPARDLWDYRCGLRARLIDFVNERVGSQSLPQSPNLDRNALTIGFARRFATYKRAPLLFSDLERAVRLFSRKGEPVQIIYAGKAHPKDSGGKKFIQQLYEFSKSPQFHGRVVFVEGYDMEIGRMLVSGTDVWLNNPRRPYEASGTSGQKVAMHGGLNLSVLDGWWPEGYDGHNGWSIGHDASADYQDPEVQDWQDAVFLYDTLEQSVIPTFYERDEDGIPHGWVDRMRAAMTVLPYKFSAGRMVRDYRRQYYYVGEAVGAVGAA